MAAKKNVTPTYDELVKIDEKRLKLKNSLSALLRDVIPDEAKKPFHTLVALLTINPFYTSDILRNYLVATMKDAPGNEKALKAIIEKRTLAVSKIKAK